MLTYEKVLDTFAEYLAEDTEQDAIKARHSYITAYWHAEREEYDFLQTCSTPEELLDDLVSDYTQYQLFKLTHGKREETREEKVSCKAMGEALREKCLNEQDAFLTFERVINCFAPYLGQDDKRELVKVAHGYLSILWDSEREDYQFFDYCATPEDLMERLVKAYVSFQLAILTDGDCDYTVEEKDTAESKAAKLKARCIEGIKTIRKIEL